MRIIGDKFSQDNYLGFPIVRTFRPKYLYFKDEASLRHFTPTVEDKYPAGPGYVAVLKMASKVDHDLHKKVAASDNKTVVFYEIHETEDICRPQWLALCRGHVYMKANLTNGSYTESVRVLVDAGCKLVPGPQYPVPRITFQFLHNPLSWKPCRDRKYDVVFMGNNAKEPRRRYRRDRVNQLARACDSLGLRTLIRGGRHPYNPSDYLSIMNDSILAYSPKGSGYRCRREWEILMAGSTLVLDSVMRTDGVRIVDFAPDVHFLYLEDDVEASLKKLLSDLDKLDEVSRAGYQHAQKSYVRSELGMDERFMRAYLLDPTATINDYVELETLEDKLGLTHEVA